MLKPNPLKADISLKFLKSALTTDGVYSLAQIKDWLKQRNESVHVSVERVPFKALDKWRFDTTGVLRHDTGKFFSIEGIQVETNWGFVASWDQPIINQPEIGYLGIIAKEINGLLHFLLQAKIEPGNVNNVQLSPTVQATKSNYTQVHQGKKPTYLQYFQHAKPNQVLLDQLQSEQGARFLRKRNRNIIIKVDEEIPPHEDFIWVTMGQVKELIKSDNLVNMDTRTVISGIPYGQFDNNTIDFFYSISFKKSDDDFEFEMLRSALNISSALYTLDEILNWLTVLKCHYEVQLTPKSVFDIKDWRVSDEEIAREDKQFFRVIAANIEIENREVSKWMQPLVEPMQEGIIAFVVKKINDVFHFLVQAKVEPGNFDIVEMAPTVQCITGSYKNSDDVPFLDFVLRVPSAQIRYDSMQSEEGGRFFREQNRNMIIEAGPDFPIEVPANYRWVSLQQLTVFLKFNNYLNIQSRSLISAIRFI
jgi:dTDP-4-dehydro-6-deoxy-alpha-D-glucopyranose 2,3-dehydratase